MSLKLEIIRVSQENPDMRPKEIARVTGASKKYVEAIRSECGLRLPGRYAYTERHYLDVLEIHREQPWLSGAQVARLAGVPDHFACRAIAAERKHVALTGAATPGESGLQGKRT